MAMMCDSVDEVRSRVWKPSSWRAFEALQMAEYEDKDTYNKVMLKLSKVPPLVQASEVDSLIGQLAMAGRGERFIIQGGDCAERFIDCEDHRLNAQLKLVVQMGAIVEAATGLKPVRIARMAGQYGKVRCAVMFRCLLNPRTSYLSAPSSVPFIT
jgi:3-deoxy-7-phosphoheptulonate synthase